MPFYHRPGPLVAAARPAEAAHMHAPWQFAVRSSAQSMLHVMFRSRRYWDGILKSALAFPLQQIGYLEWSTPLQLVSGLHSYGWLAQ